MLLGNKRIPGKPDLVIKCDDCKRPMLYLTGGTVIIVARHDSQHHTLVIELAELVRAASRGGKVG